MSGSTEGATQIAQIQFRRGVAQEIDAGFPALDLAFGEPLVEVDTGRFWIGSALGKIEVMTARPAMTGAKRGEGEAFARALDDHLLDAPYATIRTENLSADDTFRDVRRLGDPDPVRLDLARAGAVATVHYALVRGDGVPLRSGSLRALHTGVASAPPALSDTSSGVPLLAAPDPLLPVDPESLFGWLTFRADPRIDGSVVLQARLSGVPAFGAGPAALLLRVERPNTAL